MAIFISILSFRQSKARIAQEANIQTSRQASTSLLENSVSSVFTLFQNSSENI